ncbi:MAG: hypothetical protein ABFR50_03835 [Candidatus Fermentibacteria bacterium]
MKNDNSAIMEELKLVLKRLGRLREKFRLSKESALEDFDIKSLENLRERSKSIYQVEAIGYMRDIKGLKLRISSDQSGMEEADDLAELCRKEAASLLMHLVSAPNRLIRVFRAEE